MAELAASPPVRPPLAAWALGAARFVAAWLVACVAASLALLVLAMASSAAQAAMRGELGAMDEDWSQVGVWLIAVGAVVVVLTGLVWPALVFLARLVRAPRGWSDVVLGAAMGAAEQLVFFNQGVLPGPMAVFAAAGGIAGLAFWLAAGRPRPPYRHLLLPGRAPAVVSS